MLQCNLTSGHRVVSGKMGGGGGGGGRLVNPSITSGFKTENAHKNSSRNPNKQVVLVTVRKRVL